MKIEGNYAFKTDRSLVFALLKDPVVLPRCIPGCQKLEPVGPNAYTTTLNVGIASIKGVYSARLTLEEVDPPSHFRITVEGKGPQGFVRGSGAIDLSDSEGGTLVRYSGDAQLGGPLAAVGQRMLQGASKMMVGQFFAAIEAEAAARSTEGPGRNAAAPPKHGPLRNFIRYLRSLLRRLFGGPTPSTPGQ